MDQERDQFRARQERRAEMRQKQMQEQKRLRRNLIIAGVVALPFFSYGGTALAVNLGEMGIILSISRNRNYTQEETL